jgi:multicopper oxidase
LPFHQIGTDQGLLSAPVPLTNLEIAPAERADLVIDFSQHRSRQVVLKSDAFVVMQFRVSSQKVDDTSSLPSALRAVPKIQESRAVQTRLLTLNEYVNKAGNPVMLLLNAAHWKMPITEKPVLGSTEIWSLINPTNDSHPIHLHLVRFQILDRQPYVPWLFQTRRELRFIGPPEPPDPNEAGWKDTVRAHSKMVTRIIVPFEGFTGRYVWHCHILEHEDNEMMRPYEVIAASWFAFVSAWFLLFWIPTQPDPSWFASYETVSTSQAGKNRFSFDSLRSLGSKIGWVRPWGKRWHGCFRRTELDPETNETKLVTHSFVLGSKTEMSKSQARKKLEDEITKLGGRSTGDQSVVNGAPFEEAALHQ